MRGRPEDKVRSRARLGPDPVAQLVIYPHPVLQEGNDRVGRNTVLELRQRRQRIGRLETNDQGSDRSIVCVRIVRVASGMRVAGVIDLLVESVARGRVPCPRDGQLEGMMVGLAARVQRGRGEGFGRADNERDRRLWVGESEMVRDEGPD